MLLKRAPVPSERLEWKFNVNVVKKSFIEGVLLSTKPIEETSIRS
jgi:hypothetical protein